MLSKVKLPCISHQTRKSLSVTQRYYACAPRHRARGFKQSLQTVRVFDKIQSLFQNAQEIEYNKELDGPNMVQIDLDNQEGLGGTSEGAFGPLAVLLVGYMQEEVDVFRKALIDIDADMVKIIPCTAKMLEGTLQEALESDFPAYEQPPLGQRRAIVLSGMYGSEVGEIIAVYREAGLPYTVFAAAVPNNYQHVVKELVEEIWEDDRLMRQRREAERLQAEGQQ